MRKRKRLWVLMYKRDGRDKVWVYEKLRKKEIAGMMKHGWKKIDVKK